MGLFSAANRLVESLRDKRRKSYLARLVERGLKLGNNVDIIDAFFFDPSHCFLISIGDNCTICPGVRLIAHDASTKKLLGYTKIGLIEIRENCFIGDSAIVLPGVKIGPGAIVGAGAVVTQDIPPETIAAGNPARVIGTMEAYKQKIESLQRGKKVFDEGYFIDRIDERKRREILNSLGDRIGFIL